MSRKIHTGLTHLFAGLLVVQFFLAGLGVFTTVHDKQFKDSNFDAHATLGSLLVLVALLIVLVALVGRWSRRVTQTSGLLFGLMIVQMLLAGFGADDAPVLGGLHVVNALVIVGVTFVLVRESRAPAAELAPA
jgi:peptidoglycan/LPS O-acetylase OafA/YrhL